MEKGKVIIWTVKRWEADPYPFHDDVTNYTEFYENLKDRHAFATCLASLSDEQKIQLVADRLALKVNKIILRSKKAHRKAHPRKVK